MEYIHGEIQGQRNVYLGCQVIKFIAFENIIMKIHISTMQNIHSYGYKKYNDTRCAVSEFEFNDLNLTTEVWIDAAKGTVMKTVNRGINESGEYEYIEEYTATYNVVTDEDVKKPDLTGYTLIETDGEDVDVDPSELPSITIDDNKTILQGPEPQEQNYVILD